MSSLQDDWVHKEICVGTFQAKAAARLGVPQISLGRSKEKTDTFPVQVFMRPLWGGTKTTWVQTDNGVEDLVRVVVSTLISST